MLIFLYFFTGHLIGDFLFQTNCIVKWKQSSIWGVLIHSFLVFLGTIITFIPYLHSINIWEMLFINAVLHFFIDYGKVKYEKKFIKQNPIYIFLLDQILHICIITILIKYFSENLYPKYFIHTWWFNLYTNTALILYITGFLFFSYTCDILYFIFSINKQKNTYQRAYFFMILRIFIFACIFLSIWWVGNFYLNIF